jgi:hypothetical protein
VIDPREDQNRRNPPSTNAPDDSRHSPAVPRADSRQNSVYAQDDLKIPKIELPKGGGALKSIDEKFRVNAANGTASLSVPLPVSKTRSEFGPALSLSYDSGSGNGVFGLGWTLTHVMIQRRTDKRLPEYRDPSESDIFLLSEAEDMVPALVNDGLGNWNPDEFVAPTGESVKRYRPRIESTFARIERITAPGATTFYWKVTSKENVVTVYGRSANTRIADPVFRDRVFKWLPELSYDEKGNCLEYLYAAEDFQSVPASLHETNRIEGLAQCANCHLKRVKYGNKNSYHADPAKPFNPQVPVDPGYFFELVFDYGDHDPDAPTEAIRPSISSSHEHAEGVASALCLILIMTSSCPRLGTFQES